MTWNMISVLPAMVAMSYFGRRTLMLATQFSMSICLFAIWIFEMEKNGDRAIYACATFLLIFEIGVGSIYWIYVAEVCNSKAVAVATANLYFWQLIVGLMTPPLMNRWLTDGKVFIVFGTASALGFVYVYFYMKETKGLN